MSRYYPAACKKALKAKCFQRGGKTDPYGVTACYNGLLSLLSNSTVVTTSRYTNVEGRLPINLNLSAEGQLPQPSCTPSCELQAPATTNATTCQRPIRERVRRGSGLAQIKPNENASDTISGGRTCLP